ncbi:MAG: TolC family protein [Opitutaceae bacterium]
MGAFLVGGALATQATEAPPPVTLDALVEETVTQNPELRFFEAEIAAAKGGRRQAGIFANPELAADVGGKRVRGGGISNEGTAWSVSVMQTFEFPGRMSLRKAIANRDIQIAEIGFEQFRAALEARARTLGYNLLAAQQKAESASEVADRLQALFSFLVQREPGGITPLIELRIVEASVLTFRKQAIEASQALQSALFEVNRLRGKPLGTPLRIAEVKLNFPSPPPLEMLLSAARQNNFEIRMRQTELEQQGLHVSLSQNQRWPEITVGPFLSRESAGERETVAGVGISLPLPVWNRNAGNIDVERARQQQAEVSLFLTQLEIEQAVMEQFLAYQLNAEELRRWQQDSIQRFHEAAELGDRHYRLGSLPIATYIELQREHLDALDSILSLQAEALEAQQQLEVLTRVPLGDAASSDHQPQSQ